MGLQTKGGKHTASGSAVECHIQRQGDKVAMAGGVRGEGRRKMGDHPCPGKKPSHLRVPMPLFSLLMTIKVTASEAKAPLPEKSLSLVPPLCPKGYSWGPEFLGSCGCAGNSRGGWGELGPQPVTFSVGVAPMVEP